MAVAFTIRAFQSRGSNPFDPPPCFGFDHSKGFFVYSAWVAVSLLEANPVTCPRPISPRPLFQLSMVLGRIWRKAIRCALAELTPWRLPPSSAYQRVVFPRFSPPIHSPGGVPSLHVPPIIRALAPPARDGCAFSTATCIPVAGRPPTPLRCALGHLFLKPLPSTGSRTVAWTPPI